MESIRHEINFSNLTEVDMATFQTRTRKTRPRIVHAVYKAQCYTVPDGVIEF